ncbi:MAG: PilX N-terminal domain-containing pilus assembly protein [Gammaproteobacteria bacterium]|nr:PilX N-terminal domain-containing pilus assembly protein [Gammaproteobacteria bacterium]
MKPVQLKQQQQGAALVVGLILLVVITVLAVSGMSTATTELAMARNDQNFENAFQAAENGLERALSLGSFDTTAGSTVTQTINAYDSVTADITYENWTIVPDKAYSLGAGSGVAAFHFQATSRAESRMDAGGTDRDSTATHTQAFYVVGPEPPTL